MEHVHRTALQEYIFENFPLGGVLVSLPNLVKIANGNRKVDKRVSGFEEKKNRLRVTRPSPFFASTGPVAPKIVVAP